MDFLSKINANAGIDVKKGSLTAPEANLSKIETYDGLELHDAGNCSSIIMNTEFFRIQAKHIPLKIDFGINEGIEILPSAESAVAANMSFNTEFFKLQYGLTNANDNYAGPNFEITSKYLNGYKGNNTGAPTAEIKSQRLDISAYSKNDNDFTGTITLRATPNQYVDETTKEPIDNDHDATFVVDGYGIHLDSGCNPDGNVIELYTNGTGGLIDIATSNMTTFASARKVNGNFTGGLIETQSHGNSIEAESFINMKTGGKDLNNVLRPGASIRLSSGVDSTNTSGVASVKVKTTEFLVDLASESSVQFNFGTGLTTNIDHSGINFNNSATIGIPASTGGRLAFCSNNMFFETNELAVSLINGGCMVFNNNGLNISTTPTGSVGASGNVLLSQSLRNIERMTQSEYDALAVKNENTLYIIAG